MASRASLAVRPKGGDSGCVAEEDLGAFDDTGFDMHTRFLGRAHRATSLEDRNRFDGRSPGSRLALRPPSRPKSVGIRASFAAYSCGGQPGHWRDSPHPVPFHPHARAGEPSHARLSAYATENSLPNPLRSPAARGTRPDPQRAYQGVRVIPAGAGNTLSDDGLHFGVPVHPRWRGEHQFEAMADEIHAGSSPLAREHDSSMACSSHARGSSPLARGTLADQTASIVSIGGSSPLARGTPRRLQGRRELEHGSSPLARGTPTPMRPIWRRWRFIPAGAGNTPA